LGCGVKKSAPSEVSGKVTYNGNPVTGGTLVFHSEAGVYPASITTKGTYQVVDLPEGECIVTIDTEQLNPNKKTPAYDGRTAGGGAAAKMYGKASGPPPGTKIGKQQKSPAGEGSPVGEAGTYVKIPKAYSDRSKSPLKVTLKRGSQEQNFELKD
jgi:hypothetical protein